MKAELLGLNGGKKQFWLRIHRKEVENYYYTHGAAATMKEYNLRTDTLARFFERAGDDNRKLKLSQADKYILEYARLCAADLRKRITIIEGWAQKAAPVIALGQALIDATTTRINIKVEAPALPKDELRLNNLIGSRSNEAES